MENIIYGVQHDDDNGDDDDDNAGHPQIGGNLHPLSLALQSRTAGDNHYLHRHHHHRYRHHHHRYRHHHHRHHHHQYLGLRKFLL